MTSPSKAAADGPYKDGGPAFPISLPGWGDNGASGMTLRDYFAARAMQATLSSDTAVAEIMASDMGADRAGLAASVAEVAYMFADAMLKQRASAQHEGHGETETANG